MKRRSEDKDLKKLEILGAIIIVILSFMIVWPFVHFFMNQGK